MTKNCPNVLVSGASVSGLSVAYWLANSGFNITVVERAPHLRPGGQALDVRGPALDVAEHMGIVKELRDKSTKLNGMSVVDAAGKEIFRSAERTFTGGRLDSPDIEILRDDLCDLLFRKVENECEFIFGDSIAMLDGDDQGVDVTFTGAEPRRFDLVVGADGLHSKVRQLAFGPEKEFIHFLGTYIAVFGMPNFLGLDRWQVFHQIFGPDGEIRCGVLGLEKDSRARTYVVFNCPQALEYDYRDVAAQKQIVLDRVKGMGWQVPKIMTHMLDSPDFYFDGLNQIRMDNWSRGRTVLLGDAAYSVSPRTGQGTTVAMVGAYVLAGELAAHRDDLLAGIANYQHELSAYIARNQETSTMLAGRPPKKWGEQAEADSNTQPDGIPDFGAMVAPFALKHYQR